MVNYNMSVNKLSIFVDLLIVNEVELFIVQFCFYFLDCRNHSINLAWI